ncbi:MAG TPA: potassium-transporting ATPase subunit KdpA, partial [Candidatus Margulisiibacteriota bacterium]|nr:potassium-transporting ATPase subunit KdpA [Candidatus Margulisiibacteriota bacterium]
MNWNNFVQSSIYLTALLLLVKPLGIYMARVYQGKPVRINVWFGWLERLIYRISGVRPDQGMTWKTYAAAMLLFNIMGIIVVYAFQRLQAHLFLNPMHISAVSPDLAFNTAVSFATNTNWQSYGGETALSYLTQMLALTVQNFVSAATGMAILVAVARGFIQKQTETIGNFWVDLVRSTVYILMPLALILSLALVSQGVVQTFRPSANISLIQPSKDISGKSVAEQVIALGPAASQIAIKQLGTNG